jgi:hypothetical protein
MAYSRRQLFAPSNEEFVFPKREHGHVFRTEPSLRTILKVIHKRLEAWPVFTFGRKADFLSIETPVFSPSKARRYRNTECLGINRDEAQIE